MTHRLFLVSILAKGALGLIQLATAAAIATGATARLPGVIQWLVSAELAEDPNDFLAARLMSWAGQVSTSDTTFYLVYFSAHGLLHVGIVAALLTEALWAFPVSIAILAVFVGYQVVEWMTVGGVMLPLLSAIDLAVIALTLVEWRHRRDALRP